MAVSVYKVDRRGNFHDRRGRFTGKGPTYRYSTPGRGTVARAMPKLRHPRVGGRFSVASILSPRGLRRHYPGLTQRRVSRKKR